MVKYHEFTLIYTQNQIKTQTSLRNISFNLLIGAHILHAKKPECSTLNRSTIILHKIMLQTLKKVNSVAYELNSAS
ncbi:hypothetical protein BpHYR1_052415 [Brachionus plicatilis]|uniref:Uncharacterized protein n=1 Tax=Brachionus plicatilis TaxID=10195 RepID=A0A3M7Q3Y4_BRAPC|nr:hypothetical protein BpHYR1_052415 [Brachionus plicatilis]